MHIDWRDAVAYGYVALTVTGALAAPLAKAFPAQRWLATVAKVCATLGPHWGVLAALGTRGAPSDHGSAPDINDGGPK